MKNKYWLGWQKKKYIVLETFGTDDAEHPSITVMNYWFADDSHCSPSDPSFDWHEWFVAGQAYEHDKLVRAGTVKHDEEQFVSDYFKTKRE